MHPVLFAGCIIGGGLVIWCGYEAVNTLYEWHKDRQEQREYEEYVRSHAEKGRLVPVTLFENDEDDDDEPLGKWKKRDSMNNSSSSELRHRNINNLQESHQYELFEIQRSLSSRRSLLERENEILLQEEAELERKRNMIRSKGNTITGVFKDEESDNEIIMNPFQDYQPLTNTSSSSPVVIKDDQHSNPFADQSVNPFEDMKPFIRYNHTLSDSDGSWADLMEETSSADNHHHVIK